MVNLIDGVFPVDRYHRVAHYTLKAPRVVACLDFACASSKHTLWALRTLLSSSRCGSLLFSPPPAPILWLVATVAGRHASVRFFLTWAFLPHHVQRVFSNFLWRGVNGRRR